MIAGYTVGLDNIVESCEEHDNAFFYKGVLIRKTVVTALVCSFSRITFSSHHQPPPSPPLQYSAHSFIHSFPSIAAEEAPGGVRGRRDQAEARQEGKGALIIFFYIFFYRMNNFCSLLQTNIVKMWILVTLSSIPVRKRHWSIHIRTNSMRRGLEEFSSQSNRRLHWSHLKTHCFPVRQGGRLPVDVREEEIIGNWVDQAGCFDWLLLFRPLTLVVSLHYKYRLSLP